MNDTALFGEHPDATVIRTVPCAVCGEPADLMDPENDWVIAADQHESCMTRDPDEPDDPDAGREDDLT